MWADTTIVSMVSAKKNGAWATQREGTEEWEATDPHKQEQIEPPTQVKAWQAPQAANGTRQAILQERVGDSSGKTRTLRSGSRSSAGEVGLKDVKKCQVVEL